MHFETHEAFTTSLLRTASTADSFRSTQPDSTHLLRRRSFAIYVTGHRQTHEAFTMLVVTWHAQVRYFVPLGLSRTTDTSCGTSHVLEVPKCEGHCHQHDSQPLTQSVSQSVNQSINHSINHSMSQLLNHSITLNQPLTQSLTHSINHSINQSITHSINQSISDSINQSHLIDQSINQSIYQSVSQSRVRKHIVLVQAMKFGVSAEACKQAMQLGFDASLSRLSNAAQKAAQDIQKHAEATLQKVKCN